MAATAGIALALSARAEIPSANVVGYQTIGAGEELYNVAVQFKNMASEDGSFTIADKVFGVDVQEGDRIYIFDPLNYNVSEYEYNGSEDSWYVNYADGTSDYVDEFIVSKGSNFSYWPVEETAVTVAGEVEKSGTYRFEMPVETGEEIYDFTNPFPAAVTVADLASFANEGDRIYLFDAALYNVTEMEYNGPEDGWYVSYADGTSADVSDPDAELIKAGEGGFYWPVESCIWEVTFNY